ncbi:sugar transporter stl1 [Ophiostoma piceae UAMH 11346]|uniref:Sugar transporter stl1 n=1 Tax=Ophiostoma piceae (strain UAMH 11346) TaxID=1262450 RepID=S3BZC5_OPHP1|nr:sugar transporter stl1 [Ophiostoma piceae UAMH 11346]
MYEPKGRALMLTISLLTSLGFMLIGFDNGLMGGLIDTPAFKTTFDSPSSTITGLIVAIYEVGCFFGSLATAVVGERLGRRRTVAVGCAIMIVGAVLQASAFSRAQMIVGRIVSGVGMGFINSTVPVIQAEFSPKASRGIYVCAQLSTLNFGIFLVYWIDYGFSSHVGSYAWRVPVVLQCFCILPMFFILAIIPETPRWLAAHDRPEECLDVLRRVNAGKQDMDEVEIQRLHGFILQTVAYEASIGAGSWRDLLKEDHIKSRKRLLIACGIQSMQQLGGINAIIYYSSTLFSKSIGFDNHMSALMSGFLQTWFFVASFIPWFLIDRIGRRPLLLSMISLMAGVMIVQTGLIYQVENSTAIAHAAGIGAAAMLFVFQGAFTVGFQATVWVYPSEILPLRLRQRGSSISTASNWIFNYMIVQITPIALTNIGWRTYIIFAVLNTSFVPIVYLFFPETKGLELEDMDRLFSGDNALAMHSDKVDVANVENIKEVV